MGNPCAGGGADVTCGYTDTAVGIESRSTDVGDGTFLLEWWSDTHESSVHEIFVKIDGVHVLGSPTLLSLTSAPPDMSKSEVDAEGLKVPTNVGQRSMLRLTLHDANGNPALPQPSRRFGVTLLHSNEKDIANGWRKTDSTTSEQNIIGGDVVLSFFPKIAGDLRVHLWSEFTNFVVEAASPEFSRLGATCRSPQTTSPTSQTVPSPQSPSRTGGLSRELRRSRFSRDGLPMEPPPAPAPADDRVELPGSPFFITVTPSVASAANSSIGGIMLNVHGSWRWVPDAAAANGINKEEREAEVRELDWDPDANNEPTLQVGDTVRIAPDIVDAFGNLVEVTGANSLDAFLFRPDGNNEELDMSGFRTRAGAWSYEARYELEQRGDYKLTILLDHVELPGSPVTWTVANRAFDGRRPSLPSWNGPPAQGELDGTTLRQFSSSSPEFHRSGTSGQLQVVKATRPR